MPLTCGKCPVSDKDPGVPGQVWCDSRRMMMSKIAECGYSSTARMLEATDWYQNLALRLREAAGMREAEEQKELTQGGQGQA